jgi:hypothetical protein
MKINMPENKEQFTKQEEIKVEQPIPVPQGDAVPTTNRKTPIKRYNAIPLKETHGMTTEANRFKET